MSDSKKPPISVVLATHNEEANMASCLEAVQPFATEIIIADGESTDKTLEIAKKYNAKVIKTTNKPNFHINKQMAMDKAKSELVLQLDADEVVDNNLANWIKHIAQTYYENPNSIKEKAWFIKRKNYFLGRFLKKGGQYPDPVIRFYVNGYAKLPQKDVHEQMTVNGEVGTADGHLLHYSNPTFQTFLRKWNQYTSLKASQLNETHEKISFLNTLKYGVWLPKKTFLLLFLRHKGFQDGLAGFVFALMSGLYHLVSYLKLWELKELEKQGK